jgi:hypothetical protein
MEDISCQEHIPKSQLAITQPKLKGQTFGFIGGKKIDNTSPNGYKSHCCTHKNLGI